VNGLKQLPDSWCEACRSEGAGMPLNGFAHFSIPCEDVRTMAHIPGDAQVNIPPARDVCQASPATGGHPSDGREGTRTDNGAHRAHSKGCGHQGAAPSLGHLGLLSNHLPR
jgi:hypothetical protein